MTRIGLQPALELSLFLGRQGLARQAYRPTRRLLVNSPHAGVVLALAKWQYPGLWHPAPRCRSSRLTWIGPARLTRSTKPLRSRRALASDGSRRSFRSAPCAWRPPDVTSPGTCAARTLDGNVPAALPRSPTTARAPGRPRSDGPDPARH